MLSALLGLLSATSWGTSDFFGGLASRRSSAVQATFQSETLGLLMLLCLLPFTGLPVMSWADWAWCLAGGAIGAYGLEMLYRALSEGQMSVAAPVSALMAALLPVAVAAVTEGLPRPLVLGGFVLALASIWLISQSRDASPHIHIRLADLRLPLLAGVFFGAYFIMIHQGSQHSLLGTLIVARTAGSLTLLGLNLARGTLAWPKRPVWAFITVNALGDIGGNALYILAGHAGRMDVAAVLGSLYPGMTVVLAGLVLHERLTRAQVLGILAALAATAMIAL